MMELDDGRFLDLVMRPHRAYFQALRGLFGQGLVRGLAHITGGGIRDNLTRILPADIDAEIHLACLSPPEVFRVIRNAGAVSDEDMLRTFNLGVGLALVCEPAAVADVVEHLGGHGVDAWEIGEAVQGNGSVHLSENIDW